MAIESTEPGLIPVESRVEGWPADSLRFELLNGALMTWFLIGMFLDGWAHNHNLVDNTFFTPWHAVLYSGVLAVAVHLAYTEVRNVLRGHTWSRALPRGYSLSLIGVLVFFAGGGFDFLWHDLFGFEANIEALLSPSHLLLASGAFLFLTGPIRAAWLRPRQGERQTWVTLLPAIIGLCGVLSLLTFFTQYAYPFVNARVMALPRSQLPSDTSYYDVSGIASVVFYAAITVGLVLLTMRRWVLPVGSLFTILAANTLLMYWMRYNAKPALGIGLIAGLAGGLFAEILYRVLRPSAARPVAIRVYAFAAPFLTYVTLFALLISGVGIWWSIHMWLGASFLSGVAALFLSYLAFPPKLAEA